MSVVKCTTCGALDTGHCKCWPVMPHVYGAYPSTPSEETFNEILESHVARKYTQEDLGAAIKAEREKWEHKHRGWRLELAGVVEDAVNGDGFDDVCLTTLNRVMDEMAREQE